MYIDYFHLYISPSYIFYFADVIHSDLKPANFLLVCGRLKLIDFGIASSVQNDMTSVYKDVQTGTFNYISPESLQITSSNDRNKVFRVSAPHTY